MKKLRNIVLAGVLATSFAYADTFIGVKGGVGSGTVSLSDSNGDAYTFTDSDSITTKDTQIYIGLDSLYLFYQTGTIETDTNDMGDFDYNAFGIGYFKSFNSLTSGKTEIKPEFMIGIGYDKLTGNGNGSLDDDKQGILIPISLGVSMGMKSFPIKLTADIGYDIHVVNDTDSTENDSSWNYMSLRYNLGIRYNF